MAAQIGKGSQDAVILILIILCKLVLLFLSLSLSIVFHFVIVASRSWGWEIFRGNVGNFGCNWSDNLSHISPNIIGSSEQFARMPGSLKMFLRLSALRYKRLLSFTQSKTNKGNNHESLTSINSLYKHSLNWPCLKCYWGRGSKNQNGNLRWYLPWKGGVFSATYLFWKMFFSKTI